LVGGGGGPAAELVGPGVRRGVHLVVDDGGEPVVGLHHRREQRHVHPDPGGEAEEAPGVLGSRSTPSFRATSHISFQKLILVAL
jgi:hypothetical protein